jgi:hypothetical protein
MTVTWDDLQQIGEACLLSRFITAPIPPCPSYFIAVKNALLQSEITVCIYHYKTGSSYHAVCGCSPVKIVGSNLAGGMVVCLL